MRIAGALGREGCSGGESWAAGTCRFEAVHLQRVKENKPLKKLRTHGVVLGLNKDILM